MFKTIICDEFLEDLILSKDQIVRRVYMFVRNLRDVEGSEFFVEWGNGTSHRLLTEKDKMGFTVCHTIVRAGSESVLEYRDHLEACYCIAGSGEVEDMKGNKYPIAVGDIYVLDKHDKHYLRGSKDEDLILVSVFNPPLKGTERHNLKGGDGSAY
jgi:L-ectoine synthase